jgi:hypothetical protein
MTDFEDSIAHTAHGLVHGERAKTYGHPRFDFTAIAKVWTGLLQDLLKDDAQLDAYRISILMTGLKLCRLVKSPQHKDSRIDTIGYMLTMERLDEPEEVDWDTVKMTVKDYRPQEGTTQDHDENCRFHPTVADLRKAEPTVRYNPNDAALMAELVKLAEDDDDDDADEELEDSGHNWARENSLKYSQVKVWFDAGETKYINGQRHTNGDGTGKLIVFPFLPGTEVTISKFPSRMDAAEAREMGVDIPEADPVHDHEQQAPCVPPCPVWAEARDANKQQIQSIFGFTGETVEMKPSNPWDRND